MRDIKFRAFIEKGIPMYYFDLFYIQKELQTKDSKFMQYTGLKDKNGIEIYEGDIIKTILGDSKVFYDDNMAWFACSFGPLWEEHSDYSMEDEETKVVIEVIGNIYENPELLE